MGVSIIDDGDVWVCVCISSVAPDKRVVVVSHSVAVDAIGGRDVWTFLCTFSVAPDTRDFGDTAGAASSAHVRLPSEAAPTASPRKSIAREEGLGSKNHCAM